MRPQREQQAQDVGRQEQHRETNAQLQRECCRALPIRATDRRGYEQRDGSEQQHPRLEPCRFAVVLLRVVPQATEQQGHA